MPVAEAQILPFTAEVIPLWKQEEERIRALVPPSQLATRAEELADALSEVNVALLEIHIATQRNDGLRRYFALQRSATAARGVGSGRERSACPPAPGSECPRARGRSAARARASTAAAPAATSQAAMPLDLKTTMSSSD